ncbi:glycosyltransferase family 9 protein [Flavobacterium psychrotrophum]|uniref:glycosyltransferase family 9 protein n=1 Tax=Flavobacterium psychrotrophum TaxID=2294119 RepID=UPI000E312E4A|nr:glycosyltransferase family 9 protein [Flavobacterium psychrotrophum]
MPHRKKMGHKHLLLLRFSAMGDVAMTVPLVNALAHQYPDVRITIASRSLYKPFFEAIPGVNIYEADFNKFHKGFIGLWRLYKELKALRIYAVADLHNVLRSKIITKLFAWRGKKTATTNKMRDTRKQLTAAKNKVFEQITPVTQRHAEVLAQLGFPIVLDDNALLPKLELSSDVVAVTGEKAGTWIGIAPFAQHRGKVYPKDLMQEVINTLATQPNTTLFLFGGGKDEAKQLKKFAKGHTNIQVIAGGKMLLKQELQIISNLNLMLSMDSANAHMAAMYGVKVVTLWGATHPYAGFAPFLQPATNAVTSNREQYPMLPTSIYGNKVVPGYEDAMRTITPQMVVNKVNDVLKS